MEVIFSYCTLSSLHKFHVNTGNRQMWYNILLLLITRWSHFTRNWVHLMFMQRKMCITCTNPCIDLSFKWRVASFIRSSAFASSSHHVPPSHCICLSLIQLSVSPRDLSHWQSEWGSKPNDTESSNPKPLIYAVSEVGLH